MITREEALQLLEENIQSENMRRHSYASEAVLRALARKLNEDEEKWGIAGLLHDIDVEITKGNQEMHGLHAKEMLEGKVSDEITDAIAMHNELATRMKRTTKFQHALAAGETITGLITATALVYPDKKISSVKSKSVTRRMKQKAFAASANRDIIMECEQTGIPVNEFVELALDAMKKIDVQLGL